jgi:hypothetical protein
MNGSCSLVKVFAVRRVKRSTEMLAEHCWVRSEAMSKAEKKYYDVPLDVDRDLARVCAWHVAKEMYNMCHLMMPDKTVPFEAASEGTRDEWWKTMDSELRWGRLALLRMDGRTTPLKLEGRDE